MLATSRNGPQHPDPVTAPQILTGQDVRGCYCPLPTKNTAKYGKQLGGFLDLFVLLLFLGVFVVFNYSKMANVGFRMDSNILLDHF